MDDRRDNPGPHPGWQPHLAIGITGHRESNAAFAQNSDAITASLVNLFEQVDDICRTLNGSPVPVRMHCLLAEGVDQIAAGLGSARGWPVIAPLPFGADLNLAINAQPKTLEDAIALCEGRPASDPLVEQRAEAIRAVSADAHLFELADNDATIRGAFEASLADPGNLALAQDFDARCSDNVALAGRTMIERVDLMIAVWDHVDHHHRGGTGHTIAAALALGTPVLVIDARNPPNVEIYNRPEELNRPTGQGLGGLQALIQSTLAADKKGMTTLNAKDAPAIGQGVLAFYRQIETWFGGPEAGKASEAGGGEPSAIAPSIAERSPDIAKAIQADILPIFERADTISTWLSDAYRSSMCYNFVLAAFAVIVGVAYLPLGLPDEKWIFATIELILLGMILGITMLGKRRGWHQRWFETRRVAEYLRHAPTLLLLGVARPVGRWPRGGDREWPEQFARHALRHIGLPPLRLDQDYLRLILQDQVVPHVVSQRDYHLAKAARLHTVHHRLDKAAQTCFFFAVLSVAAYLSLAVGAAMAWIPDSWPYATAKLFTFLGVAFPTLGANLAGIRFFGDFERFAAISRAAAERLDDIHARANMLLSGSEGDVSYSETADLVRSLDEAVIEEISGWQSVFGAKHLDLPA